MFSQSSLFLTCFASSRHDQKRREERKILSPFVLFLSLLCDRDPLWSPFFSAAASPTFFSTSCFVLRASCFVLVLAWLARSVVVVSSLFVFFDFFFFFGHIIMMLLHRGLVGRRREKGTKERSGKGRKGRIHDLLVGVSY